MRTEKDLTLMNVFSRRSFFFIVRRNSFSICPQRKRYFTPLSSDYLSIGRMTTVSIVLIYNKGIHCQFKCVLQHRWIDHLKKEEDERIDDRLNDREK